jgi:hypothetical protein
MIFALNLRLSATDRELTTKLLYGGQGVGWGLTAPAYQVSGKSSPLGPTNDIDVDLWGKWMGVRRNK